MEKTTQADDSEPEHEPVVDIAAALATERAKRAPAPEIEPVQPDGHSAENVHSLSGLRDLYDTSANMGPQVDGTGASFAHENKLTRILHFAGEYKKSFGRVRYRRVVTIKPGKRAWIAHTVNPDTGQPESWECYGSGVDPARALANQNQCVLTTSYKRNYGGPWLRFWRWWYGRRILDSVDYAKWLTGFDVPRARHPHELKKWLLDQVPAHRQTSKSKAAFLGIRSYIGELISWL